MQSRWVVWAAALACLGTCLTPVEAGWLKKFCKCAHDEFRRANNWPQPFLQADRDAVWAPLTVMVYNGWRDQNTLTDDHFKPGKSELTEAGRLRVQHIVTRVPSQFRAIFVLRAATPEETAERIAHVQEVATTMSTDQPPPEVFETQTAPDNWPADYVNAVEGKFIESTPAPRIPEMSGSSSSSGSSSAGS